MDSEGSEVSVADMYGVVYRLKSTEWVACGKGWSQIHLYHDKADDTHRIVGWTVSDYDVIVNANVTHKCTYKKKSADFHKMVTESQDVLGFGFYKKEESLKEAERFLAAVKAAIENDRENTKRKESVLMSSPILTHNQSTSIMPKAESKMLHTKKNDNLEKLWDKDLLAFKMGALEILPPQQSKSRQSTTKPKDISAKRGEEEGEHEVRRVEHNVHVKFDPETRRYTGLPKGWEENLAKQFALGPDKVECLKVEGYVSRIPLVLIQMKKYLFENNGLQSEGIFRLAPDQNECKKVKDLLDRAKFKKCADINVIANLIKVWFREMPDRLLTGIAPSTIQDCKDSKGALKIVDTLKEPNKSLVLWLLDMLVDVAKWSHVNKMNPRNLAIVMAPNLFTADNLDPMAGLAYSQQMSKFLYQAIMGRMAVIEFESKQHT
mmetsp:Transcript_7255/g.13929  ORF Transcript_7255/g.13929 Transcript_7255/m.13929 type:complete len:434 (+) Transcript_7255:135-1436(+)